MIPATIPAIRGDDSGDSDGDKDEDKKDEDDKDDALSFDNDPEVGQTEEEPGTPEGKTTIVSHVETTEEGTKELIVDGEEQSFTNGEDKEEEDGDKEEDGEDKDGEDDNKDEKKEAVTNAIQKAINAALESITENSTSITIEVEAAAMTATSPFQATKPRSRTTLTSSS